MKDQNIREKKLTPGATGGLGGNRLIEERKCFYKKVNATGFYRQCHRTEYLKCDVNIGPKIFLLKETWLKWSKI